ncbi:MAG: HAMP domain-containing sensor histidine kinase [Eubacteriales bacterium]
MKRRYYNAEFLHDGQLKRRISRLWVKFVIAVFCIMLATSIVIGMTAFILLRSHVIELNDRNPFYIILAMLIISTSIGTFISIFTGRRILIPLNELINAEKEVAGGNFSVRLNENHMLYEYRELSRNFNVMVSELSSIETLRNDFVLNVSHEFKTPIASIQGYASLLADDKLPPGERAEYLKYIVDSSRQLSSLTNNILRISKLDNQEIIAEKNKYSLDEQIRQAILLLESAWSEKNISFELELEPVMITASEELLMQVWTNIIGNAVKFSPQSSAVAVKLSRESGEAVVTVTDHGVGMDEKTQKHIFEKFYQGDKSRYAGGNGLGLALVRRIIDLSGGTVTAESSPGNGSVFRVSLPAK